MFLHLWGWLAMSVQKCLGRENLVITMVQSPLSIQVVKPSYFAFLKKS